MSAKERIRLDALARVTRREITVVEAAGLMRVSLRQARRLWKRFKLQGDQGLVHRARGRASNRRIPEELRDRIVARYQQRYGDFGPTLACEKLAEDGLAVSPDTLTAILKDRELHVPRRKRREHRQRRERRKCFGELIQIDGSHHDWFEARAGSGKACVLMVMVDDATGWTYARFYPAETSEAAFDVFGRGVKKQGIPRSIYSDRHGIYRSEEDPGKPTQFGRAMEALSVELICARSPQAKGRVERRHGVFQDRLVKEMRLRGISDMEQGNALLEGSFLKLINGRYTVKSAKGSDLHRHVQSVTCEPLEEVLCVREKRVVGRDWCVRWKNRWLQLETTALTAGLAGKEVEVLELPGGELKVKAKGVRIEHKELSSRPAVKKAVVGVKHCNNRVWKPGASHPWKRVGAPRKEAVPS